MSRTSRVRRALRLVLAAGLVAAAGLSSVVVPGAAFAEGSRDFYPDPATCGSAGSCRANIEWRTDAYGPTASTILRRTLFTVFAHEGEFLEMGSSAVGVGDGDIVVWNPGQVHDDQAATLPEVTTGTNGFRCSDQRAEAGAPAAAGMITTRAQEQAGPQSVTGLNPAGYVPCHYQVPATGLYKVAFYGPTGRDSDANGSPTGDLNLASPGNFDGTQGTSIAAWDLTVRADDTSTTDLTGRVFTYALAAFTGANARPIDQTLYATTLDGYEYRVDTNGLDPNGFVIYGNEQGFLDPEGNPLNHDVVFTDSTMKAVQGGVRLAPPTYPISFTKLSQDTLDALGIDDTPAPPSLTDLQFDGANTGSNTYVGRGGTFSFSVGTHGTYSLVISRDGTDFDPTKSTNRVLRGVVDTGSQSVTWDGNDNAGDPFPAHNGYAVRAEVRGGVYHFPLLDAENSTKGGPSFKLLNPPGDTCPFGNGSCTTSFYDDRGYHTSAGDVGTPGQVLSGDTPPTTDHSDVFTGYDSTSTQRAWGAATGSTGFGNIKGLDSWTYFPSSTVNASLNVLAVPAAPAATDDAGTVQVDHDLSLSAADGVLANDAGTSLRVTDHTGPAHGTLNIDPDGSYTYSPDAGWSGHDSFGYTATDPAGQSATAMVTLTVSPEATDDSGTTQTDQALEVDAADGLLANDHGSGLAVTHNTTPAHGSLTVDGTGAYTFSPDAGWSGSDSFDYTATDADGQDVDATVQLTVKPRVADHSGETTAETRLTVPAAEGLLAGDAGSGLNVSHTSDPAHGTASASADGSYTYLPDAGWSGPDSFTYTVTDATGQTATATVQLTVLPTARNDEQSTPAGTALMVADTAGLLSNARGSALTVTSHTSPTHGTVTTQPNGAFTYTPAAGYSGGDSFTYTVTDATGQHATATVLVTVTPKAPDDLGTANAGTPLQVDAEAGVLVNDTGIGLSVTGHTEPAHGVLDINADGSYTYTADSGWSGEDSFTYTATDSSLHYSTATVHLTVLPTAVNDEQRTTTGMPLTVAPDGVLGNDHGSALSVTDNTDPEHGSVTVRPDGGYTYTPPTGWSGADSFTYTATDADGHWATATVTVHVQPRAYDDTGRTTVGHEVTLHPLANDLGAGLAVTSVSRVSIDAPAFVAPGTAKVRGESVVYTPARGVSGVFRFTYDVQDAAGQPTQAVDTVTVAPRAVDDSAWTPIDTPVVLNPLANDRGTRVQLDSGTEPAHGTVLPVGNLLVFAPEHGYVGTTDLEYTLRDAAGQLSTAHVSVLVKPSDAKVKPDELSTGPGQSITFDPTVNDPGRGSFDHTSLYLGDATGQHLVRTLVTPAGTFTVAAHTGKVTFAPAQGFIGRVWNVSYVVTDHAGRLHHSTIMVHIGDQAGGVGRSVDSGLKPGRDVVAATGTGAGLKPGRVITGELASTGNPVGPVLPLAGVALVGLGILLVRRRPAH